MSTHGPGADEEVCHGKVRVEEAAGDGAPEVWVPGHVVPAPEGAPHRGHQTPANCVEHKLQQATWSLLLFFIASIQTLN